MPQHSTTMSSIYTKGYVCPQSTRINIMIISSGTKARWPSAINWYRVITW